MSPYRLGLLVILLTAVFFRLHHLPAVPPGLTHDEADHGISAWSIVQGERPIYFTIGNGREPLYDYSTAVLMSFLGPTYLAGRLTAVFYSLILIAGVVAWVRRAFDPLTALYSAAGLTISFWPVMTARQLLRSETLPALFVLAVYCFWRGIEPRSNRSKVLFFLLAGVWLGLTFYTYLPSRLLWVIFPVFALSSFAPPPSPRSWPLIFPTALLLLTAVLLASPLFYYLYTHPQAEVRIDQLSEPLRAAWRGEFAPLWQNSWGALRLFTSQGDTAWRYNLAGQPLLPLGLGILFYGGVGTAVWSIWRGHQADKQRPGLFLVLLWLLVGFSPALVTGPTLSTTQTIGMQPALYVLLAVGIRRVNQLFSHTTLVFYLVWLLFGVTAVFTYRTYFIQWANHPEVRVQYETTLVTALTYLQEQGDGHVALSTTTPAAAHSPAVAQMMLQNENVVLHWFDGNASLRLPGNGRSTFIFSGFAPLNPALQPYFAPAVWQTQLPLPATDLDRPLTIYQADNQVLLAAWQQQFVLPPSQPLLPLAELLPETAALAFLGYDLQTPTIRPGEEVRVATWWRVIRPLPAAQLFVQLLKPDGVLAQQDRLDVPATSWHTGDYFIQLHTFTLPPETAVGSYPLITGLYDPSNNQRLPIQIDGQLAPDHLELTTLTLP